jgi:NAD(P)-dependent dehydrogenase (short-subunit alcohol dehydrogenase family)
VSARVAVVTGGGDGIGAGIATCIARAGYDLAIWEVREDVGRASAEQLAQEHAVRVVSIRCDVSKQDEVLAATEATVARLGRPYALVNNAGITRVGRMEDVSLADWQAVIDVNLTGVFLCTQAVGRHMLEAGQGAIVNIASVSGEIPQLYRPAYSPTKAGVILLTQVIALEWGPRGVRCNALSPGQVWTSHSNAVYQQPEMYEVRRKQVPLKRIADPIEMGDAAVYLLSDQASYINGVNLKVDAGLSLTMQAHMPTTGPDGDTVRPVDMYSDPVPRPGTQEGTADR